MGDDFVRVAAEGIVSVPDSVITAAKLADNAVTTNKIIDSAVTSAKIADGTIVNADVNASAAIDVSKLSGVVASATVGNLLTANQASLETDTSGWTVGGSYFSNATGFTFTRDATTAYRGSASGKVVADGTVTYQGPFIQLTGLAANTTYTVVAMVKTSGTGPGVSLNVRDSTGAASYQSTVVSSSSWTEHRVSFTTTGSATAMTFSIAPRVAQAETFWFDCVGVWKGAGGNWELPGLPITGTTPVDGSITSAKIADGTIVNADINASAAIDVSKLSGVVTSAGVGNLLTANQASFETSVPASGTNCTITQDATYAVDGTKSMLMTSLAAGAMDNSGSAYSVAIPGPGTYTVYAKFRSDQTAMGAVVLAVGSGITQDGARANATSSGWTTLYGTFSATAATTVSVYISTSGGIGHPSAGGQKLWIDTVGVWRGAGGLWALPGTPIANLGTYTDESVGRRIFTWDTVNSRWQMTYGDTGWRDISALLTVPPNVTIHRAYLRRVNSSVFLALGGSNANGTAQTVSLTGWTGSAGVTPTSEMATVAAPIGQTSIAATLYYYSYSPYLTWTMAANAPAHYPLLAGSTSAAWPTALPGSAVGSIPT